MLQEASSCCASVRFQHRDLGVPDSLLILNPLEWSLLFLLSMYVQTRSSTVLFIKLGLILDFWSLEFGVI